MKLFVRSQLLESYKSEEMLFHLMRQSIEKYDRIFTTENNAFEQFFFPLTFSQKLCPIEDSGNIIEKLLLCTCSNFPEFYLNASKISVCSHVKLQQWQFLPLTSTLQIFIQLTIYVNFSSWSLIQSSQINAIDGILLLYFLIEREVFSSKQKIEEKLIHV